MSDNPEQKIAYERHPVSPERKAELRGKGYKILDIQFAPADVRAKLEADAAKKSKAEPKA